MQVSAIEVAATISVAADHNQFVLLRYSVSTHQLVEVPNVWANNLREAVDEALNLVRRRRYKQAIFCVIDGKKYQSGKDKSGTMVQVTKMGNEYIAAYKTQHGFETVKVSAS